MLSQHVCLSLEQFPCRKWTAEATLRITKKMVALSVIKKFASFVCMSSALLCWTNRRLIRELIFLQAACDFRDAWWKPPPKETSTDQPDWRLVPGGRECDLQVRQEYRQATWIFPIWTSKPPVDRHGYGSGVPVWPKNGARARGLFHKKRVCMISACLVPGFISNLVIRCANSDLCLPFAEKNLVCPCKAWKACCLAFHSSRLCN